MGKGQLSGRMIIYLLVVVIAGFVIFFGYKQIGFLSDASKRGELLRFNTELQNSFTEHAASSVLPYGSVSQQTFKVPRGVHSVCFLDDEKEIDMSVDTSLSELIESAQGFNVYLKPVGEYKPEIFENFKIDSDENPLCIIPRGGRIALSLESVKGATSISPLNEEDIEAECTHIKGAQDPDNSLDIVFLGYNYDSVERFSDDTLEYISAFEKMEPFASNIDTFSFYRVERFFDFECTLGNWIQCNNYKLSTAASSCPNDYIILLVSRSGVANAFSPIRSSAVSNIAKINTAQNSLVFMHEFGHLFGGLADEYSDDRYYSNVGLNPADFPNCDTEEHCPQKWADIPGSSCYAECSLSTYVSGTPTSIMREVSKDFFGAVNEDIMMKKLAVYGR